MSVALQQEASKAMEQQNASNCGLPLPYCPAAPGGAVGAQAQVLAPTASGCPLRLQVAPKRKRHATEQQHYTKLLQLATSAARVLAQRAVEVPRNYILDLPR